MKHKKLLLYSLLTFFIFAFAAGSTAYYLFFSKTFRLTDTTYIYIHPGDSIETVCHQLSQQAHPSTLTGIQWLATFYDYDKHIRSGRYAVRPDDNAFKLIRRLASGQQTPVNLIIPSVRTIDKLSTAVSSRIMLDSATVASALTDSLTCARLGYTPQTIACLFIPNTYEVYWDMTLDQFLARMTKEKDRFWNDERRQKAKDIGLTPEEVVTLASIVDEETAKNDEKPIIAGLYMNRLKRGMLLQADPTVKFACGDFRLQRILHKHLAVDSPYNTYLHAGLPPGPIRIPSIAGIESVLNYARHDYLYMCAKEDFSGRHNFAATLREHQNNALRYQRELNRRKIY